MPLRKEEMTFVVGMALKAEKAKKHVSQKLIDYAAEHGIELKVIDEHVPLEDQGHFDVICQKIRRRGM
jgi:Inositol 1,3,4-trisphosphate 5/6-kinase pre-ATP-grasp domain